MNTWGLMNPTADIQRTWIFAACPAFFSLTASTSHFTPILLENFNSSSAWSLFLKPPPLCLGRGLQHIRSPFFLKHSKHLSWRKGIQLIPQSQTSLLEADKEVLFVLFKMEGKIQKSPGGHRGKVKLPQTQKNPPRSHSSSLNNAPHGIKPRLVIAEYSPP